jgi:hypothetical protein
VSEVDPERRQLVGQGVRAAVGREGDLAVIADEGGLQAVVEQGVDLRLG